jgi:hypothetical protein
MRIKKKMLIAFIWDFVKTMDELVLNIKNKHFHTHIE